MSSIIRKCVDDAENAFNELSLALQKVESAIKFRFFNEDDKPFITSCNGSNEIVLVWDDLEMDINDVIFHMETRGYIIPDDFNKKMF